jgi:hypothetical protein
VYYVSTGVMYSIDDQDESAVQGISGVGVTYNFNRTKTSPFIMGGGGLAMYGQWVSGEQLTADDLESGFGLMVGGGIHLAEIWTLSAAIGKGSAGGTDFWHARAAINVLSR